MAIFFERLLSICNEKNIKPNTVAKALDLSDATATKWKKGATPNGETLTRIADYLGCSVDYLLGRSDAPEKTAPGTPGADEIDSVIIEMFSQLNPEDKAIVLDLIERLLSNAKA